MTGTMRLSRSSLVSTMDVTAMMPSRMVPMTMIAMAIIAMALQRTTMPMKRGMVIVMSTMAGIRTMSR